MSIDSVRNFIAQDMSAVDEVIRQKLYSQVALIRQISEYIINNGGKRLRPALVILSAGVFGYSGKYHHQLAAVVEFIHTATLLHDDVVDESELRRNNATANALFGNAASVLVGDFLYSRAFQMMVEVNSMRVMQVLADATNVIAEGEVLQLLNCRDPNVEEDNYLRVIRYKTAKLFEAATRLGAILGNATEEEENAMAVYGMHLGTAFQLIDDLLDYSGDHQDTGKNLGDDLAEGKPTLPLIYAMRTGSAQQANIIRKAIETGGESGFDSILTIIEETGALNYAKQRAYQEVEIAAKAISLLKSSHYKDCLLQLAEFAVTRNH
ncbi:MAG TPA: octaprenyl diphosphate synthase [Nitrosomonas sp.]|nr:octaprenyl diphosphate synthase [Nitrosomonas sp.]HMW20514.1 octaprenyl diphosphate synthase [Nitrosomonas sp.]HMW69825.1 octaprenyl diphosphate synthase [Nitrosomonas sp.]HMY62413.1 octaprenyl diphosphate synthase [Nitrosomonas sp.]HMY91159.1 octaprenyl diphosphate synthase [Nitrosomonas sp.]